MLPSTRVDPTLLRAFREAVEAKIERDLQRESREAELIKKATLPRIRHGVDRARSQGMLSRAWLFGSFAWGQPGPESDVDILVEGGRDRALIASLVGECTALTVHVVAAESAPRALVSRAEAEGIEL